MEYFCLEQDHRIKNAVVMNAGDWNLTYQELINGDYRALKDITTVLLSPDPFRVYPDILDSNLFAVSETISELLLLFYPQLDLKTINVVDSQYRKSRFYYAPQLEAIDCLTEKCKKFILINPADEIEICSQQLGLQDVFRVTGVDRNLIIASLAFVECLLRRKPYGIRLRRVTVI